MGQTYRVDTKILRNIGQIIGKKAVFLIISETINAARACGVSKSVFRYFTMMLLVIKSKGFAKIIKFLN